MIDGRNLDLSGAAALNLTEDSWLHVQSAAELKLPTTVNVNGGLITKDGTIDGGVAWGFTAKPGVAKYFEVLEGILTKESYTTKPGNGFDETTGEALK